MPTSRFRPVFVAAGAAALSLVTIPSAFAGTHGRFVSVQGRYGGFVAGRSVTRTPGSTTATRGVQTDSGRGFVTTRDTTHGDGTLNNSVTRTYNDGQTATRTGSITRNGNGSVTVDRSHTGVAGNTQSSSRTISRTDDGFDSTRNVETSNGRSATETGSVAFGDGSMTVDRSVVTGSGASASQSTTYTRGY